MTHNSKQNCQLAFAQRIISALPLLWNKFEHAILQPDKILFSLEDQTWGT